MSVHRLSNLSADLVRFMDEHIYPNEQRYREEVAAERWRPSPVVEALKPVARKAGLWNLFTSLSNAEYATLCEIMGRSLWAPEVFNCSAPDTGNMEVLIRYGTSEQKERW